MRNISGCLVSHEHGDHAFLAKRLAGRGVDIYSSEGTLKSLGLSGHRFHALKEMENAEVGGFAAMPFRLVHDAEEPFGFYVCLKKGIESLAYITDTMYMPYALGALDYLMIEANYERQIIAGNAEDIGIARAVRTSKSHLSIDGALEYMRKMDRRCLKEVWLLHLSNDNSDEASFKRRAQEVCGCEVYVA